MTSEILPPHMRAEVRPSGPLRGIELHHRASELLTGEHHAWQEGCMNHNVSYPLLDTSMTMDRG
jgi:hypothetical protein